MVPRRRIRTTSQRPTSRFAPTVLTSRIARLPTTAQHLDSFQFSPIDRRAAPSQSLGCVPLDPRDRLSDFLHRLRSEEHTSNSSHANISYAVFCLKKKK